MAKKKEPFHIDLKQLMMPISLVLLLVGYYVLELPFWALAMFCLWIPLFYIVYPNYVQWKWNSFDRIFGSMFQKGEYDELLQFYRGQWFLRRFGPQGEMLGKLGLVYIALNKFREAEKILELAIWKQPARARDRIYVNLGNVKYELGKYDEAKEIYEQINPNSPYHRTIDTSIALAEARMNGLDGKGRADLEHKMANTSGILKEKIEAVLQDVH